MNKFVLDKKLLDRWLHNILVFLAPVVVIYAVAVVGVINTNNGAVKIENFIPNSFTWGAVALYLLNTILDYARKLQA